MKKIKNLLLVLLIMLVAFPFSVKAEKEEENKEVTKEPVNIYLFHSNTCGYCKAAIEWFGSIEEEYGDYFDLVDYEVSTEANSLLWNEVATMMGDTPSGVPYMVIGDYSYPNGFASDTIIDNESKKTMGDEMIERIMEIYENDDRYDVMVAINNKPSYDNVVTIVSIVVIAGIVAITIFARRQSR